MKRLFLILLAVFLISLGGSFASWGDKDPKVLSYENIYGLKKEVVEPLEKLAIRGCSYLEITF